MSTAAFAMQAIGAAFDFPTLQRGFWLHFGSAIDAHAASCMRVECFELAGVSELAQLTFMSRIMEYDPSDLKVSPAFHGTDISNFSKIFEQGFRIPGEGNDVEIVNGTTHGAGTYVANVDAAWLAMQPRFCRGFGGDSLQLLVWAVLHTEFVSHHKDAKVASQEGHVVPVGVVTGSRYKDTDSQGRGSRGIPHMVEPILVWDMVSLAATSTADISALLPGGIHKQTYH